MVLCMQVGEEANQQYSIPFGVKLLKSRALCCHIQILATSKAGFRWPRCQSGRIFSRVGARELNACDTCGRDTGA